MFCHHALFSSFSYTYTVHSFVELVRQLTGVADVQYLLSEKFCQDPVEKFFGKQRACGGRNENPNVKQFMDNTISLRVQGSAALEPLRGNCSRKRTHSVCINEPLPKRKRYSKKKTIQTATYVCTCHNSDSCCISVISLFSTCSCSDSSGSTCTVADCLSSSDCFIPFRNPFVLRVFL